MLELESLGFYLLLEVTFFGGNFLVIHFGKPDICQFSVFVKNSTDAGIRVPTFSRLTKFHDISMIFPDFLVNFQVFFHYF